MNIDIIVVGAGLSGAVIAERFAKIFNKNVLVVEKRDHIGGNCYDFINELGIRESKYGMHIFHTNKLNILNYVVNFGSFVQISHKVLSSVKVDENGNVKFVPIPVNRTTINMLFNENLMTDDDMKIWLEKEKIQYDHSPENGEEVIKSLVGERIYEMLFKYYTLKQWGKNAKYLDKSVLSRVTIKMEGINDSYFPNDEIQCIPIDGYSNLISTMLTHPKISVLLNTDFMKLINSTNSFDLSNSLIVFTGQIDEYFNFSLGHLEYRSLNFVRETLPNVENFQSVSVVNYPGNDVKFTRIVEYSHNDKLIKTLTRKSVESVGTVIVKEFPCENGEAYYPVLTRENKELYEKYEKLAQMEKNVYFVGRLANYKYLNMDQAIENALGTFKKIMSSKYQLIVARYNEKLDWALPYNFLTKIYNKGDVETIPKIFLDVENLPNVGRESHTYLYHIIKNYDNLSEYTIFSQGNPLDHIIGTSYTDITYSKNETEHIQNNLCDVFMKNFSTFFGNFNINVFCIIFGFDVDKESGEINYHGTWKKNYDNGTIRKSQLTFLEWWEKVMNQGEQCSRKINFEDKYQQRYISGAIFSLKRELIHKHPKTYYEKLIKYVDDHINPEESLYFERAWLNIFCTEDEIKNMKFPKISKYSLIIEGIPNVGMWPLQYIMEVQKYKHKPNTLWMEFGVASGRTINYISKFTTEVVYGFDSFEGLPDKWRDGFDKGTFTMNGQLPIVNSNVVLVKGLFQDVLETFIVTQNKKVSFIHIDSDLYSSAKYILNTLKSYIDENCIIVFDELVNFPEFDGENSELRAFYEFVMENKVKYKWIGMNGIPTGMDGYEHENVGVIIESIN